jgi:uncharacterized protein (TIGR03067 family)
MRPLALLALVTTCSLVAGPGRGDDAKKVSIEGNYTLVGLEVGGEKASADVLGAIPAAEKSFKITADQIVAIKDGKDDPITYKLDTSKTPYHVDFVEKMDGKAMKSFGIAKIDGDKLIIIAVESEKAEDRPKEFKTTKDNKAIMLILEKKK